MSTSTEILRFTSVLLIIFGGDLDVSFELVLIVVIKIRKPYRSYWKTKGIRLAVDFLTLRPVLHGHNTCRNRLMAIALIVMAACIADPE